MPPLLGAAAADRHGWVATAHGAFTEHLLEAIGLNRHRLPLYARETGGRSVPISRALIRYEHLARPLAWYVDRLARPFEAAGVPITSASFISMSRTPEFRSRVPVPLPPAQGQPLVEPVRLTRTAWAEYRRGGFDAAAMVLEHTLEALAAEPAYHCMLRHVVESALRIARLAPIHARLARERGLGSAEAISWLLLSNHFLAFPGSARLDRRALPLQAEGVPIIARDVPPIPIPPAPPR